MLFAVVVVVVMAVGLVSGQTYDGRRCVWQNWTSDSWPVNDGRQFFQRVMPEKAQFLNTSDFQEGGAHHGERWEDVFWERPNYYRPLGFRYARLLAYNERYPCLRAEGAGGYMVELMVWTFEAGASITVADMSVDDFYSQSVGAVSGTDEKRFYQCFHVAEEDSALRVAVFCKENCIEGDTDLLWRFRRSAQPYDTDEHTVGQNTDMWCMTIANKINWPDDIDEDLPDDYVNANEDDYANAANTHMFPSFAIFSSFALLFSSLLF